MDEQKIKFIVLGDSNVGKTNLLLRYIDQKFRKRVLGTIGIDYKEKKNKFQR